MTKKEFIKQLEQFPDNAELRMFDSERLCWRVPYVFFEETTSWDDDETKTKGVLNNFIGLE